jgi:GTP-binding protein EngB required for normal cell division
MERIKRRSDVVPLLVVTKLDKLPKAKQRPRMHEIAASLDLPKEGCFGTSTLTRGGIDTLRDVLVSFSADRPY